jgi:phosphomannomutase
VSARSRAIIDEFTAAEEESMTLKIECFKAYDIRGQIPNQINTDIAYRVGNATVEFLGARSMVLGRDMRLTSQEFADAVSVGM